MNPIFRGLAIYVFLLLIFRITGKRSLSETTTFEFVLLLIISETIQQAMVGEDFSITTAFLLIMTLMGADLVLSLLKNKFKTVDKITEGTPVIIVDNGKPLQHRMKLSRVAEEDVLNAARSSLGLERMEEIKFAVLENDGSISIIPYKN
ncbi:MAG TPA: DUF421 domain-containing protein [Flavipsychrobacter sp.]|nr:DUF421 domain-containing protein [Flavipsychrobacter sp.]